MTWIVTGATGLLGPYLLEAVHGIYNVTASRVELTDEWKLRDHIKFINPSVLVHAAAYTDVDGCEADPNKAARINHRAVETIANSLKSSAKLIYISTDMVYPDTPGPHPEWDVGRPLNTYGLSKRLGEVAALKHHNTLVLRTNFFGASKNARQGLTEWILNDKGDDGRVYFGDVFFSPLHMKTLANLIVECAERNLTGVFNAGAREGISKYSFAKLLSGQEKPVGMSSYITPRPRDLRLDVSRLERVLGREMPTVAHEIWNMRQ